MKAKRSAIRCHAPAGVRINRDEHGVPHVQMDDPADLAGAHWAMGYCHALDRGLQMLLMRILIEGRAAEVLEDSEEMVEIDRFFRRVNWAGYLDEAVADLDERTLGLCRRYCDGVNQRLARRRPWELRLVGYRPDPWRVRDSLMLSRAIGYLTLAQSQAEMERLLVEMIQAGVSDELLAALFPDIEDLPTAEDRELLERVHLTERIVPPRLAWHSPVPRTMASNNWVLAGRRTESGSARLANDPHLEVNRLPNVWYEMAFRFGGESGDYWLGATMPGIPAPLVGRNRHLAWGATYAFMDAIDSWIEDCRDGQYRRGDDGWNDFLVRRETIRRKKGDDIEVRFYENGHGTLDGEPTEDGLYLATRWSAARSGAVSMDAMAAMWAARSVEEGMTHLGRLETAFNWVLADREGHIGYQMSGLLPRREAGVSGLFPRRGWHPELDWQGFVRPEELPRSLDPESGYIVTANQDLNHEGAVTAINLPMADYRARRIAERIEQVETWSDADTASVHLDTHSVQADAFLGVLEPILPDSPAGRLLRDWDHRYAPESRGATLFEAFYRALFAEVFGAVLGSEIVAHLQGETGIFVDFYGNFDAVLLSEDSPWFGGRSREELFRAAFDRAAGEWRWEDGSGEGGPPPWGEVNQITLRHILLGGKLPSWLGFDRGPVPLRGGRATPHQGQVYRSGGRETSFGPSLRFFTDLGEDVIHTVLAGGPSDRRFSRYYVSDLAAWRRGDYKLIEP